jgi:hypothetical protein
MQKEEIIDVFLAFLAPLIFEGKKKDSPKPKITFLSSTEVQIEEFPGELPPVRKVYNGNNLEVILQSAVDYDFHGEENHFLECWLDEHPDVEKNVNIEDAYSPDAVPGHIYHTLRVIKEFLDNHRE